MLELLENIEDTYAEEKEARRKVRLKERKKKYKEDIVVMRSKGESTWRENDGHLMKRLLYAFSSRLLCDLWEVRHFNDTHGRPMIMRDWHHVMRPGRSVDTSDRAFERFKQAIKKFKVPHSKHLMSTKVGQSVGQNVGIKIELTKDHLEEMYYKEISPEYSDPVVQVYNGVNKAFGDRHAHISHPRGRKNPIIPTIF